MDRVTRCAITGASGYIGSHITSHLADQGMEIVELSRRAQPSYAHAQLVPFTLGDHLSPETLVGVDALVHCSYDFTVHTWDDIKRVNVDGSARLLESAARAGVRTVVVISTISAFAGCRSLYGRAKLLIEHETVRHGGYVIRPGLVYDDSAPRGIVGSLAAVIRRSPFVPLIGNGEQVLYPCHVDDLAHLVRVLLATRPIVPAPIVAASRGGMTFREILMAMGRAQGKYVRFIPIPYTPVLAGLKLAEAIGMRSRLRSDSLISLMNQDAHVDFSSLDATGLRFRGLMEAPS